MVSLWIWYPEYVFVCAPMRLYHSSQELLRNELGRHISYFIKVPLHLPLVPSMNFIRNESLAIVYNYVNLTALPAIRSAS